MRCRHIVLVMGFFVLCSSAVLAWGKPENVLVVKNSNSTVSQNIAAYYMAARSIPAANLVTVTTQDSAVLGLSGEKYETLSYTDYQNQIQTPIKNYMTAQGLTNTIQYIVLTKGIPHRISAEVTGGSSGGQSVDSMLAALNLVSPYRMTLNDSNGNLLGKPYVNKYWAVTKPFSHATYGGYLVTRLDGYTEADAKALVDHAMAPCTAPLKALSDANAVQVPADPVALWLNGTINPSYTGTTYSDYNADITQNHAKLSSKPFVSAVLEQTISLVASPDPLTCYVSWGSNAGSGWSEANYHSLTFAARALAETAVSTSGRSMLPETVGQSMIADLIAQGVAGAKGYVTEPYLIAIASPTIVFDFYTSGRNLAESFYAASRLIGWKDVVLGDPLCTLELTDNSASAAKAVDNQWLISVTGTVTASNADFASVLYLQDDPKLPGLRVELPSGTATIARGTVLTVRGTMSTNANGERTLTNVTLVY